MKFNYDIELANIFKEIMYEADSESAKEELYIMKNELLIKLKKVKTADGFAYTHEIYRKGDTMVV
jgi:hypothetical protein